MSKNIFEATKTAGHGKTREPQFEPAPATTPVTFNPGTAAKIAAMCKRAEEGVELWHEDDPNVLPELYQSGYDNTDTLFHIDAIYDSEQFS